ncbi:5'-nucleotidase [Streptomyces sp. NBC_01201]|uniref:5'-nucleotidase n=1 Tax=Streptomyces glycanivorans TaxID=3033808 RepID=A0ABY9JEK0_9ACTN|nr:MULTISPECIES: 5'-nucleotidase [unclassified Streptomyces]TXS17180.1 5'-nucleotidase [Streptomyces sp. wa22]WLQ65560.1 5'-nucleotidase [Streptomyces sp. Alt3]WSR49638.1 5'-nucleotidase [Streptomyces sp. NBC_01201]
MSKRMLRSVLATAFVGALAYGALGVQDITWGAAQAEQATAVPGDITWGAAPTDITWGVASGDITWGAPPTDITWGATSGDITWGVAPTGPAA